MRYWEYLEAATPVAVGYTLGRLHQWSRMWRGTPLRRRLEKAVDAFRRPQ
ncbi:hypothetical protein [Streptomyces sp. NPDC048392]